MNEAKVRKILGSAVADDNSLRTMIPTRGKPSMTWLPDKSTILLDGIFEFKTLRAIVWWMKNKGEK